MEQLLSAMWEFLCRAATVKINEVVYTQHLCLSYGKLRNNKSLLLQGLFYTSGAVLFPGLSLFGRFPYFRGVGKQPGRDQKHSFATKENILIVFGESDSRFCVEGNICYFPAVPHLVFIHELQLSQDLNVFVGGQSLV